MKNQSSIRIISKKRGTEPIISARSFDAWFGSNRVLKDVNLRFRKRAVNCIVGPSGGGKSTLLRSINRINDEVDGFFCEGSLLYQGRDVYGPGIDPVELRTEIGMVFQKPCVFPRSIAENVLFGLRNRRSLSRFQCQQIVEEKLRAVALWREVAHRLNDRATSLSVGQQQRLCIARSLAIEPQVLLFDEPTSALDPLSTRSIEDLIVKLAEEYTIVFVTHDIMQARRIAEYLVFICEGEVIEQGQASTLFATPQQLRTREYLAQGLCDC